MRTEPLKARTLARAAAELRKAISEAKLAYEFGPSSFTFGCLSACLAAEQALAVLRDHLSDHFETSNPD